MQRKRFNHTIKLTSLISDKVPPEEGVCAGGLGKLTAESTFGVEDASLWRLFMCLNTLVSFRKASKSKIKGIKRLMKISAVNWSTYFVVRRVVSLAARLGLWRDKSPFGPDRNVCSHGEKDFGAV